MNATPRHGARFCVGQNLKDQLTATRREVKESQRILNELEQMSGSMYVAAITRAMVSLGMKDANAAFAWLDAAAEAREVLVCYLAVGPIYDFIRGDSRYDEMMQRIGLLSNKAALSRRAA